MSPRHALTRPEPLTDRPIEVDAFGDVWQRQGPPGSPTWYSAQRGVPFEVGRHWTQVEESFGPMTSVGRPSLPELGDTTGSIPVISG